MTSQSPANLPATQGQPPAIVADKPLIKQSSRQARHLAQAVQLEESGTSPLVRFTMLVVSLATIAFIIWSALTTIDEVALTEGTVIPNGSVQQMQHLEGGIVQEILARDGQLVEEGQPLLRLSPAQALADLDQTRAREASLLLKAERLRAFVEGRQPDFSIVGPGYERLAQDNMGIYRAAVQARETARAVILSQLEQKRADLNLLEAQHRTLRDQVDSLAEELRIREELVGKGLVTRITYLDNKRELSRVKGELARIIGQTVSAREAVVEIESRLTDNQSTLMRQTMDEMGVAVNELAQVQESIGRLEDRVQRLVITAPARGYVKGLVVKNVGAVIAPGALVAELVPVDNDLKVDARITTRDIGHVKVGQPVRVKVTTYDFARYGSVLGTLQAISASSFVDEKKGEPYFKATISLERNFVGETQGRYVITPGMTVQAEIITGEKTLLQYMLKPVFTQLQQSFHER